MEKKISVIMKTCISGARGVFEAGTEYKCSRDEADRLVAAGYAKHPEPAKVVRKTKIATAVSGGAGSRETAN